MALKTPFTKPSPTVLPDWRTHSKLKELQSQYASLLAEQEGRQLAVTNAKAALDAASKQLEQAELKNLIGKLSKEELEQARQRHTQAKTVYAQTSHDYEENQRLNTRLKAALDVLGPELRQEVAKEIAPRYKEAVETFKKALEQAAAAHEEMNRIYKAAEEQFPLTFQGDWAWAAGLPDLRWGNNDLSPAYTLVGALIDTKYSVWRKRAEAYLNS